MKRILVLSLVVFGVVAFSANAGATNMLGTMELNLGYAKSSTEVGSSTESMEGGLTFGASYWRNATPTISWGAEVSFDNMGTLDNSYYDPFFATTINEEYSTKVFRVNPAVRMNFGAPVGPSFYLQGGAGLYNVSWDYSYSDGTLMATEDGSSSKLGVNFGAGVGFPVGPKTKLNFTGSYHMVSGVEVAGANLTDNSNYLQLRAGIGFGL